MNSRNLNLMTTARRFIRGCKIIAIDRGYWRSIRVQSSLAADGSAIPWYTYPCIEYLESYDLSKFDVFEFGAGNSSKFWASRARTVTSVEDDVEWHAHVASTAAPNQTILFRAAEADYVKSLVASGRSYHLIIVDGKWRRQCVEQAICNLQAGGMILLDNSDRFPSCCELLRSNGYFQVDFNGPGPINPYCWTTSIFVRASCSLQERFKDPHPIGGLNIRTE